MTARPKPVTIAVPTIRVTGEQGKQLASGADLRLAIGEHRVGVDLEVDGQRLGRLDGQSVWLVLALLMAGWKLRAEFFRLLTPRHGDLLAEIPIALMPPEPALTITPLLATAIGEAREADAKLAQATAAGEIDDTYLSRQALSSAHRTLGATLMTVLAEQEGAQS